MKNKSAMINPKLPNYFFTLIFCTILSSFTACGVPYPTPKGFTSDATRYHKVLNDRAQVIKSLSGELGVELWENSDRVAIRQLFAARPPHQLRIDTLTPFEQPLATLIYHDQLLALHDIEHGRFAVGSATTDHFERLTRVRINPSEMSALLSGQVPRLIKEGGTVRWDEKRGRALLTLQKDDTRQFIFFDELTLTPRVIEIYRAEKLEVRLLLAEYTKDEPRLPQRLRVELPHDQIRVDIKLKDFTMNPELPDIAFEIKPPPGISVSNL